MEGSHESYLCKPEVNQYTFFKVWIVEKVARRD
jgi:hypothetical protein